MRSVKKPHPLTDYLKREKPYTMCFFYKGFLDYTHFVLEDFNTNPYKDHAQPLLLIVKTPVKQDRFIRLYKDKQCVIWEGFYKIDCSIGVITKPLAGYPHVMVEYCWCSYDSRYLDRAIQSIKRSPIYVNMDPIDDEEHLIVASTISQKG